MTGDSTWQVGVTVVPSATGSVAITGLGGKPKAVIFLATNWTAENSVDTSAGAGIARGMVAPLYSSPGTLVQSFSFASPGDNHWTDNYAIGVLDFAGNNKFYAQCTSLDADGFTLNWLNTSGGGNKVVWLALMDAQFCGGYVGTYNANLTPGWKAGSSFLHGCWGGPVAYFTDRTQEFWGSAAYPTTSHLNWQGAGLTAFTLPTSPSSQYNISLDNFSPDIVVAEGGHFTGPFLVTSNIVAYPNGSGLTSFMHGGDAEDGGMSMFWDDEDSRTGRLTPPTSVAGTSTVSGLPFAPGLVFGYSLSDEPNAQSSGAARGAVGFSVATPSFQFCAIYDNFDRGAYQSFTRGFADVVHNTNVHAGQVALTADGFILTTDVASASPAAWVWHAFGHPKPQPMWLPPMSRVDYV